MENHEAKERGKDETMGGSTRILVVDDNAAFARWLAGYLSPWGDVRIAFEAVGAMRELADGMPWLAAVIDMCLPDAPGLGVAAELKRIHPETPILIVTANLDLRPANAAYLMGLDYLEKPFEPACLSRFMSRTLSLNAKIAIRSKAWQKRHNLTDAQEDILRRASQGETREAIANARSASCLTVKKQIADMLKKSGDASLHAAVERLLREVAMM